MDKSEAFPIGPFTPPAVISPEQRQAWIEDLKNLPQEIEEIARQFSGRQLETTYRKNGWTARQVIHHLPDSHMQAYTRFKLALTMDNPTVFPYPEAAWAELPDGRVGPIASSLALLHGIHRRWVDCLRNMSASQWQRTYFHTEHKKSFTLEETLGMYSWHGRHHLAHLQLID